MHVAGIFINENNIFIDENTYSHASSGVPHDEASSPYLHVGNIILYQVFKTLIIIDYFANKIIYYV
jgi:hypothetical protein